MSSLKKYLSILPNELFDALEDSFMEILENFKQGRFEPSELNKEGNLLKQYFGYWNGTQTHQMFTPRLEHIYETSNSQIKNLNPYQLFPTRTMHIPEIIVTMYTIRNKRGVRSSRRRC